MDQQNIIDLVIEKKQYRSYKIISGGRYSATVELDYQDKGTKTSVLILTKDVAECRKFDFERIQNQYTVQALEFEYICSLQTYLIHTDTGDCTLSEKMQDKAFRKSPNAVDSVCNWIRDVSFGLKKIHSAGFVHLNIHSKTIMITSKNRAKIGVFDCARHTSTQNDSTVYGSESHYRPPERYVRNCGATDGEKYDVWCLAILTVESITGNYIARKSTKVSSWPEQYPIIYKILQVHKFKNEIKKTFPKAPKGEQLKHILRLMRHTLKFEQDERPSMTEFSILLMELAFLKYIDMRLVEEDVWMKKVPLVEVEHKMVMMALDHWQQMGVEKTPRVSNKMAMTEFAEGPKDQMLGRISEPPERNFNSHHLLRRTVHNKNQINFPVDSKVKKNDKVIVTPSDGVLRKRFSKGTATHVQENLLSLKSEIKPTGGVTGDYVSGDFNCRSKETDAIPFEHMHVQFEDSSSSGKLRSKSESTEIVKPDKDENDIGNPDLIKNTEEDIYLSKQEQADSVQSNIFDPDKITNNVHIAEKHNDVVTSETPIYLKQNNREKTARTNFSAKNILLNVVNWACDEAFYSGVMNHGSFISKVSKTLTG